MTRCGNIGTTAVSGRGYAHAEGTRNDAENHRKGLGLFDVLKLHFKGRFMEFTRASLAT